MLLFSVVYISTLVVLALVFLVGDPESDGCLGRMTYAVMVWTPVQLERILLKLPGGRWLVRCGTSTVDYACNKPNPLLQIVYLGLVIGGFLVFVIEGFPLMPNPFFGEIHFYTSHLAVLGTLLTFLRASMSDPGRITKETFDEFDHWECDGFMYVKQNECKTCNFRKIARSKHCSVCNVCVSKFDHHCPWINACVGEGNYYKFLAFLGATASLLFYAAYGCSMVLLYVVAKERFFSRQFVNRATGQKMEPTFGLVFSYMMMNHGMLIMLFALCLIMGIVVFGFMTYHFTLIARGVTTNETVKWGGIKSYYREIKKEMKKFPEKYPDLQGPVDADREAELLNPETAPALGKRETSQFPRELPENIYNKGFRQNLLEVLFPPYLQQREKLKRMPRGLVAQQKKGANTSNKKANKKNKIKAN